MRVLSSCNHAISNSTRYNTEFKSTGMIEVVHKSVSEYVSSSVVDVSSSPASSLKEARWCGADARGVEVVLVLVCACVSCVLPVSVVLVCVDLVLVAVEDIQRVE